MDLNFIPLAFLTVSLVKLFRGACGSKCFVDGEFEGRGMSSSFAELVDLNDIHPTFSVA